MSGIQAPGRAGRTDNQAAARARHQHRPRGIYAALGLLTLFAVFAATAGVREAFITRTQALRQVLAASTPNTKTIMAAANWDAVSTAIGDATPGGGLPVNNLTPAQLTEISGQLRADFGSGAVSLAPASTDWVSLTTGASLVQSTLPAVGGDRVNLELSVRQPLNQHMRLLAGRFPAAPGPPSAPPRGSRPFFFGPGSLLYYPLLQVVVTRQTADALGLRVGSKIRVAGPLALAANSGAVTFQVSGIVVPDDPHAAFWTTDAAVLAPTLENPASMSPPPNWVGGVMAGSAEAVAVQQDFGPGGLTMQWGFPLALGSVTGQQARPLSDALTSLSAQTPQLSGDVAPVSATLSVSSGLLPALAAYFVTEQSVDALLWLLWVSLAVTGVAVLLLTARMVALRRSAELTVVRARGASLWQLALAAGRAAAAVCVPAAAIGAVLGILAVSGAGAPGAGAADVWWPLAAILAVAICGPAVIAAWQHRLPRRRPVHAAGGGQRQPRARVRLVTELTLAAAAVAGIVVFRQQGTAPGAGVNLYTSAAPVLVAVPVVIMVMRIYPLVLRGLLRVFARSPGAPAFLGLARAVRSALTPALPAFALVLALTVAAFAGMVRDAVTNGDAAASWKAAGADVTVSGLPGFPGFSVPPDAVRALATVPGVTHAARAWSANWVSAEDTQLTVIVVDPASYAALVAAADGYPRFSAGQLAAPRAPGAAQPVLASPQAAMALGRRPVSISTLAAEQPVTIRVAGTVAATPAWPAGGMFVIMPFAALHSTATPPVPASVTEVLLTGPGIDRARLNAVMRAVLPPGGGAIFRSDVLASMAAAPLQHGAFTLLTLSVVLAAVLGIAVMFLELALGAADRQATLARLATMGLGERQRARIVAVEVLPAVIAAGLATWACALVLPRVVGPAINLSVFTSTPLSVPLAPGVSFSATAPLNPDVASLVLPLAGLVVLAGLALGIEIRSGRRKRVTAALRVGG
jgi:putative ABC transport system permease protein